MYVKNDDSQFGLQAVKPCRKRHYRKTTFSYTVTMFLRTVFQYE